MQVTQLVATAAALVTVGVLSPVVDAPPSTAQSPIAVSGARTAGDPVFPAQGNGGYDTSDYFLELEWRPDGSIDASVHITGVTTGAPLDDLSLDLRGLVVDTVVANGSPASFSRTGDKLVVDPAAPLDGAFTLVVDYHGVPEPIVDGGRDFDGWKATYADLDGNGEPDMPLVPVGTVATNLPVGARTWVPVNNTLGDRATWSFEITVPDAVPGSSTPRVGVANGKYNGTTNDGQGNSTWRWYETTPIVPSALLLVIGAYRHEEGVVRLRGGQRVPMSTFVDGRIAPGSPVVSSADQLAKVARTYGRYPGTSTGIVLLQDTVLGERAFGSQGRYYLQGSNVTYQPPLQQVAWDYFGNAVTPATWGDLWLATGPSGLVADDSFFTGAPAVTVNYARWQDIPSGSQLWRTPVAGLTRPAQLRTWAVQERSTMTLAALRVVLGRATVTSIMRQWLDRYAGRSASTADFVALAERVSGEQLNGFFRDWLRDRDKPAWPTTWDLRVRSQPRTSAPGRRAFVRIGVTNTGRAQLIGGRAEVHIERLLRVARIVRLPQGVSRAHGTLRWRVPQVRRQRSVAVRVPIRLRPKASRGGVRISAKPGLGGKCRACHTRLRVRPAR